MPMQQKQKPEVACSGRYFHSKKKYNNYGKYSHANETTNGGHFHFFVGSGRMQTWWSTLLCTRVNKISFVTAGNRYLDRSLQKWTDYQFITDLNYWLIGL